MMAEPSSGLILASLEATPTDNLDFTYFTGSAAGELVTHAGSCRLSCRKYGHVTPDREVPTVEDTLVLGDTGQRNDYRGIHIWPVPSSGATRR